MNNPLLKRKAEIRCDESILLFLNDFQFCLIDIPQANVHGYFYREHGWKKETEKWVQMNDRLRPLSGLIVCLQSDDFAVLKSPKGALPVRRRLTLVIYV